MKPLETLLGGYLHEDWADDYPDAWRAIDDFSADEPDYAPLIRAEIESLLARYELEQDLKQSLRALGLSYYPPGAGWSSYRAWLLAVADRVEENLRKSPAA